MDDNTARVLLTATIMVFLFACLRRFDRVSLHIERLSFNVLGLLKLSTSILQLVLRRRRQPQPYIIDCTVKDWAQIMGRSLRDGGDFIRFPHHGYNIDLVVTTHPDDDHRNGLKSLFQFKNHDRPCR